MEQASTPRLDRLRQMLEKSPADPFLLYGIALEYRKLGDAKQAIEFLGRVVQADPGYCYAWHQAGQIHESMGDLDSARADYRRGIEAAVRKNDAHARGEIEAALSMIE